jgi:hypothetical protein
MTKFILLFLGFLFLVSSGFSQSQGPNNGSSFASVALTGSSRTWSNPGNAVTSNGQRATTTNSGGAGSYSDYLQATGFGFSVPVNATILGIVVAVQRDDAQNNTRDHAIRIVKAGTIGATDKALAANWPTTEAYQSYGSSVDLWGETWTPADINNAGFGFAIAASKIAAGAQADRINHIQVTIHYSITLPVTIKRFSVARSNNTVSLNWQSAAEKNLSHYDIERSSNATDFASIGRTVAQATAAETNYSFTDTQPLAGNGYYRLKLVDADGQFSYSTVAAISFQQNGKMQLYPNPVQKGQALTLSNTGGETVTVRLYTANGVLLQSISTNKNSLLLPASANVNGQVFYTISGVSGAVLGSGKLLLY